MSDQIISNIGGGEAEFEELDRRQRLARFVDIWLVAPGRVMWDDLRTRIGAAILLGYLFMGTLGLHLISAPELNEGERLIQPFDPTYTQQILGVPEFSLGPWTYTGIWKYPLGTDALGRDLLELVVHSTPAMLKMVAAGALFSTTVAVLLGTFAGYYQGRTIDRALMFLADVALAVPGLPLIIVLAIAIEPENPYLIGLLLVVNGWGGLARSIRSQVLSLRNSNYVEVSKIMGVSTPRIILDDLLPNLMPYILINFMQAARYVIFTSVGLYFIGVLPFTSLNWGVMMNAARQRNALVSAEAFHWLAVPMVVIALLIFGLVLFSQGMDRVFNPRIRARHSSVISESDE